MTTGLKLLLTLTLALAGLSGSDAWAQSVFRLEDLRGDDYGSGGLIYPNRADMQPGDLDLASFSASIESDGTWFAVEFVKPIRDPRGQVSQVGQLPIERVARYGFYTFNVDVYIDMDRIAGSGQTHTVPGRNVDVSREAAWEKAIIVSPRPDVARSLLALSLDSRYEAELRAEKGRVAKAELEAIRERSEAEVAAHYVFPDRVRVRGRKLEFFVPASELSAVAQPGWAYTVFVTGADIEQLGRVGFNPTNRPQMMTMPVALGVRYDSFGVRGDADLQQPPVVDLLSAEPGLQQKALEDYDTVAGRLAAIPGVAPDGSVALASATGEPLTPTERQRIQSATAPSRVPAAESGPTTRPAPETVAERRTVPARLRTLNQLREEGLVTEEEYTELRRKILSEL